MPPIASLGIYIVKGANNTATPSYLVAAGVGNYAVYPIKNSAPTSSFRGRR